MEGGRQGGRERERNERTIVMIRRKGREGGREGGREDTSETYHEQIDGPALRRQHVHAPRLQCLKPDVNPSLAPSLASSPSSSLNDG